MSTKDTLRAEAKQRLDEMGIQYTVGSRGQLVNTIGKYRCILSAKATEDRGYTLRVESRSEVVMVEEEVEQALQDFSGSEPSNRRSSNSKSLVGIYQKPLDTIIASLKQYKDKVE